MNDTENCRIEFPCAYPIKIVGVYQADFETRVRKLTEQHAPGFKDSDVNVHMSKKGNYCSVNISITATGENQLKQLHKTLMSYEWVKMVI